MKKVFISWQDFKILTKSRLSMSIVFSSGAGYLLGMTEFSWTIFLLLSIGGYCVVGASNGFNQIIERDLDKLMKRTQNRPIPSGRISVNQAFAISVVLTIVGLILLYTINAKTALFSAISIFLYTSAYTPLKTKTPLSVFVGAFPGAIPFMLGWVAATDDFGLEPGVLFLIQFFWQFPHFWAIGWMLDDDYRKAGFHMLPMDKKDKGTVRQIILYTILTMIIAVIPALGVTGRLHLSIVSSVLITLAGGVMLYYGFVLYKKQDYTTARKLMLSSVIYISLVQLIYVLDFLIRIYIF